MNPLTQTRSTFFNFFRHNSSSSSSSSSSSVPSFPGSNKMSVASVHGGPQQGPVPGAVPVGVPTSPRSPKIPQSFQSHYTNAVSSNPSSVSNSKLGAIAMPGVASHLASSSSQSSQPVALQPNNCTINSNSNNNNNNNNSSNNNNNNKDNRSRQSNVASQQSSVMNPTVLVNSVPNSNLPNSRQSSPSNATSGHVKMMSSGSVLPAASTSTVFNSHQPAQQQQQQQQQQASQQTSQNAPRPTPSPQIRAQAQAQSQSIPPLLNPLPQTSVASKQQLPVNQALQPPPAQGPPPQKAANNGKEQDERAGPAAAGPAAGAAGAAGAAVSTSSTLPSASSSSSSSSSASSSAAAASASSGSLVPAGSNRKMGGRYRTFILAEAVFEVEQRYEIKEIVGHGAYGNVCSARDLKTNMMMAVKKIENIFEHRSLAKRTLRELKFTRLFFHENIMGVDRVMWPRTSSFNDINLVSELMETDLACVIRSPQELTDEHCQFFIYQVLRGLKYVHSASVVHRDLKPRNLLVNSNCDLKICDFGLARHDDGNADRCILSTYVMTRWYRAPEVILASKRYTKSVDMWAVGCILAELLGRKPLFPGRDSFHQMSLIVSVLGTPPVTSDQSKKSRSYVASLPKKPKIPFIKLFPKASPLACDLLEKLMQFEPEKRLTVEQALRHPYLEELHCEEDEPICDSLDPSDFEFEYLKLSKDDLRGLIYQEIVNNYKEDDFEPKDPQPVEKFTAQMLKALPKGKRRRRKSF